jgi:hypothetical protein
MQPEPEMRPRRARVPRTATPSGLASRGMLGSIVYGAGKAVEWFKPSHGTLPDSVAWDLHEAEAREAQNHPITTELDRLFLSPDALSTETRERLHAHIATCVRCQDVQAYYARHHDLFRLRKEPCD